MNSTTTLIIGLMMVILFSIAIIGFSVEFANDNNAAVSIADDSNISSLYVNSKDDVNSFQTDTEDTYSSIVGTTVEPGSDVIRSPSSFTITWSNVFGAFTNILRVGYRNIFGSGPFGIFLTAFISIISLLFTLYIIKTWRGSP